MIIKKNNTKAVIIIFVVLLIGTYGCQDKEPQLDTYGTLPDFSLFDQQGDIFSKSDIEGKVVLANFIFTSCTQFCPVLTPRFETVQNLIVANEKLSNRVILLSFSVDPVQDSIDVLSDYSLKNGLNVLAYDPYIEKLDDNEKNYRLSSLENIFKDPHIIS